MIRCIAIDDEALALDLLEDNIRRVPYLEMAAKCKSAFEAMDILQKEKIDLIFLDIHMPDISGIQFLKSLHYRPLVIFTTAFERYALEGFELDVVDYLLKPFSFERFLKAVNKAQEFMTLKDRTTVTDPGLLQRNDSILFVKSDYKLVRIDTRDILYIEGLKDYIKIYCSERPIVTLMSMKAMEEKLPAGYFARVHRSFIVNILKIQFIRNNMARVGTKDIPISGLYRENFYKIINKNKNDA